MELPTRTGIASTADAKEKNIVRINLAFSETAEGRDGAFYSKSGKRSLDLLIGSSKVMK